MCLRSLILIFVNALFFAGLLRLTYIFSIVQIRELLVIIIVTQIVLCVPLAKMIAKIMTCGDIEKINEMINALCQGKYERQLEVPNEREEESDLMKIKRNLNTLARVLADYKATTSQMYVQERLKSSQYKNIANVDPLTKLYNRRGFDNELQKRTSKLLERGEPFYLLLVDLDYFKQVNDIYGHQAGDEILAFMGEVLRTNTRRNDFPCRQGGDEFAVFLDDCSLETAYDIASRIQNKFAKNSLGAGTSIGGHRIHANLPQKDLNAILPLTDAVLYRAKKHKEHPPGRGKSIIIEK